MATDMLTSTVGQVTAAYSGALALQRINAVIRLEPVRDAHATR